jgi:hypothetical protein
MTSYTVSEIVLRAVHGPQAKVDTAGNAVVITSITADWLPWKVDSLLVETKVEGPAGKINTVCELIRPNGGVSFRDLLIEKNIGAGTPSTIIWRFDEVSFPLAGNYQVRIWIDNTMVKEAMLPVLLQPTSPFGGAAPSP